MPPTSPVTNHYLPFPSISPCMSPPHLTDLQPSHDRRPAPTTPPSSHPADRHHPTQVTSQPTDSTIPTHQNSPLETRMPSSPSPQATFPITQHTIICRHKKPRDETTMSKLLTQKMPLSQISMTAVVRFQHLRGSVDRGVCVCTQVKRKQPPSAQYVAGGAKNPVTFARTDRKSGHSTYWTPPQSARASGIGHQFSHSPSLHARSL